MRIKQIIPTVNHNYNKKNYFFIVFIILLIILITLINKLGLYKNNKQKQVDYSFNNLNIPSSCDVYFKEKKLIPQKLNPLEIVSGGVEPEILKNFKQPLILTESDIQFDNGKCILTLNPKLKFENGEIINAETLKHSFKIFLDSFSLRNFIDTGVMKHLSQCISNPKEYKNLFSIISENMISFKTDKNINDKKKIKELFNDKIMLFPRTITNIKKYGSKIPLSSYGDYCLKEFDIFGRKILLEKMKITSNSQTQTHLHTENNSHRELNYLLFLFGTKKEAKKLFMDKKINEYEPLENVVKEISYDDQETNKEFLNNKSYSIEYETNLQYPISYNLSFHYFTKENYLKSKMLEHLNYYKNDKNINYSNEIIEPMIKQLKEINQIDELEAKYTDILNYIFDKKDVNETLSRTLKKWKDTNVPHPICSNQNFRKALFLAINYDQMIQDITPFWTKDSNSLFNEIEAIRLFDEITDKPSEIKLKIKIEKDKREEVFFNYLKEHIKKIFKGRIILENKISFEDMFTPESFEKLTKDNMIQADLSIEIINNDYDLTRPYTNYYPQFQANNIQSCKEAIQKADVSAPLFIIRNCKIRRSI